MATELNVLTPEKLNALTQKFVDLKGLTMFWENAKSYIDTADKALSDKIDAVNITLTESNVNGQLVTLGITPDEAGREFTLTLDETALAQKLQGIEDAITGGVHFIGVSTTAITDGGTENPTINGEEYTGLLAGDIVIYQPKDAEGNVTGEKEFIWNGTAWAELGDTTAEGKRITALEAAVADINAEIGDPRTADSDPTGLYKVIEDGDAATLEAAKAYTDEVAGEYSKTEGDVTTPGTGLRGEIEARDKALSDRIDAINDIEFEFATHADIDAIFGVTHEQAGE